MGKRTSQRDRARGSRTVAAPRVAGGGNVDFASLTKGDIERIKSSRRRSGRGVTKRAAPARAMEGIAGAGEAGTPGESSDRLVVAEGDSWFDLPSAYVVTDLLDCLHAIHGYRVVGFAERGDTIENMVYGTALTQRYARKPPTIDGVIAKVRELQPRVFLFSGGGNDFAGDELASYLNHADSGLPLFREQYVSYVFDTVLRTTLDALFEKVVEASPNTQIFMHGYGYAIPSGRGARIIIDWAGPWLLPALREKNVPIESGWGVVSRLVDRFNHMLQDVEDAHRGVFHYVDLRDHIHEDDWVDELHLNSQAYARVAGVMHDEIAKAVLGW